MSFKSLLLEDLGAPVKNAIVGGPFGSNLVSKDYVAAGVPVIRGQNMGQKWVGSEFVFVSNEKAEQLSQNKARPGDLVFTQRGTLGQVSIVPTKPFAEYIVSQSQMKVTLNPEKADVGFIYYLFGSEEQLRHIRNSSIQTGVPHTNLGILRKTPVKIPPLKIQQEIASFLGSLDDRITLLRETNTTLEAIAQALFKSWFVDFDPVRAKQEGREPEGMDADTAALFPDNFEESELGLVPKGWNVGKVDTVLTRLPAKVRYTKDQITTDGVTPIYEQGAGILLGHHEGKAQYQANENDPAFIFGDHTCITHLSCEPFDISQNVIPLKGKDRATLWVYYAVKDKQTFQEYRRHWMELIVKDIVIPSAQICDAFAKNVNSYHLKMESNVRQSRTLATLRDTLLPRLISGQLRLPDYEAMVGDV
jgi:type I restriction enzyme, S subunit